MEKYIFMFYTSCGAGLQVWIAVIFINARELKRAEEALVESEMRYRALVENANDYIYAIDLEGKFTFLNKQIKTTLGLNREDWYGKSFASLIHPDDLDMPDTFSRIVTKNSSMISIFQYIEAISKTSLPVLVTGETGCGKELIARTIHDASGRRGAFVPVNVAGLDDTLFSDTLFGHKKGAFNGANTDREGMFKQGYRYLGEYN